MHSSYNYSGFVDLYISLSHQHNSKPPAGDAKQPGQGVAPEPLGGPAQRTGAAYRQRLRLVPR